MLTLPSNRQLRRYRNRFHDGSGVDTQTIKSLREKAARLDGRGDWAHHGVLMFDGMIVKQGLVLDEYTGTVVGWIDHGEPSLEHLAAKGKADKGAESLTDLLATEYCLFVWRSMGSAEKFPVCGFAVRNPTAHVVSSMVHKALQALAFAGLHTVAIICDGAGPHRKWQEAVCHLPGDPQSEFLCGFADPYMGNTIFIVSDYPHAWKKARNGWLSSRAADGATRSWKKHGKDIHWDQLLTLALVDSMDGPLRAMHKLKREHLNPRAHEKMRVYLAVQVLSRAVAEFAREQEHGGALDGMIEFVELYNNTWDVLNDTIPLRSMADPRIATLRAFMKWHEDWAEDAGHTAKKHTEAFCSWQLFFDIRLLCCGVIGIVSTYLEGTENFVVPRHLSQDLLENLFGQVRCAAGNVRHPLLKDVVQTLRHLCDSHARAKKFWEAPVGGNCHKGHLKRRLQTVTTPLRTQEPGRGKRTRVLPTRPREASY